MLVKVVATYKDREAGAIVPANVLMDISPERYEDINSALGGPYLEVYTIPAVQEPEQPEPEMDIALLSEPEKDTKQKKKGE